MSGEHKTRKFKFFAKSIYYFKFVENPFFSVYFFYMWSLHILLFLFIVIWFLLISYGITLY